MIESLNEGLNKELDSHLLSIMGEGEQVCSVEEFFDRTKRAVEFAKKYNTDKVNNDKTSK